MMNAFKGIALNLHGETMAEFKDKLFVITQTILALLITIGGGLVLLFPPENINGTRELVVGILGVVVGYYFSGFSVNRGTTNETRTSANN